MTLTISVIGFVAILFLWSCFALSGHISEQEERRDDNRTDPTKWDGTTTTTTTKNTEVPQ